MRWYYLDSNINRQAHISEAQQNLILQHRDIRVFQESYLSRYITADTAAAYRGIEPQGSLLRVASGMSRTIDTRRPCKLTRTQKAEIRQYPEVQDLRGARDDLSKRCERKAKIVQQVDALRRQYVTPQSTYQRICECWGQRVQAYATLCEGLAKANKQYRNKIRRLEDVNLKEIKARFDREQPVIDIQRQLNGQSRVEIAEEAADPKPTYVLYERAQAVNALFTTTLSTLNNDDDEFRRRALAIDAIAAVSRLQEGCRRQHRPSKQPRFDAEAARTAEQRSPSLSVSQIDCLPTQCIFCLGKDLPLEVRVKVRRDRGVLKIHFRRELSKVAAWPLRCPHPMCSELLEHAENLQNHAQTVHLTRL